MAEKISYDEFRKMDIRVAEILKAEKVEGADKLLKLNVDIGDEERTIVAGIAESYDAKKLEGKKIIVLTNLEPKTLRGIESQGMLLAAVSGGKPVLLVPDKDAESGSEIR